MVRHHVTSQLRAALASADELHVTNDPVRHIRGEAEREPETGTALCLSGGGYRAMMFHLGVLWRLNEAAMLPMLDRISSVSGGSITAGVLAMNWAQLAFSEAGVAKKFDSRVVEPIRAMAATSVDVTSLLVGAVLPFTSVSDRVARAYRKHLFAKTTLQDLPDRPRFVINATNLGSGVLMRFSKPYLADYRVGRVNEPDLPLRWLLRRRRRSRPCFLLARLIWSTRTGSPRRATCSLVRSSVTRSGSPTVVSTTILGLRPRGSGIRGFSSVTPAASWNPMLIRRRTGPSKRCGY